MKKQFFQTLKTLNWTPIVEQLLKKGWNSDRITFGILLYAMFLAFLYAYPHRRIVPSKEIDEVWHCHVLNTQQYENDTRILLNGFVDHFPYFGLRGEDDRQERDGTFEQTRQLFEAHFGVDVASEAADCEPLIDGTERQQVGRNIASEAADCEPLMDGTERQQVGVNIASEAADCEPLIDSADCEPLRNLATLRPRIDIENELG